MVTVKEQGDEGPTKIAIRVNGDGDDLSGRGKQLEQDGQRIEWFRTVLKNPYDPKTNPDGLANIGTAENYIMTGEVAKFATDNSHKLQPENFDFSYGKGPGGSPRLRKAMAGHINRLFKPFRHVEADRILFSNGVTTMCEELGFTICDAGDAVMLSRPIYQAFKADFGTKAKVQSVFVDFGDVDQFSLEAVAKYEDALQSAQSKGIRVRAIILCHPHNPLGRCYPVDTLIGLMQLCSWYRVHLIVDEIYAMSVYDVPDPKAEKFVSILSLDTDKHIDKAYLHLLYGMSKDMACGGLRLGCLYSRNERLMRALTGTIAFAWTGSLNEKMATVMLEDERWMDGFLSLSRERLAKANIMARHLLDEAGIKYSLGANAGLFLWIDLRPYLKPVKDGDVWTGEDELTGRLIANKVYVTNGKELSASEPGWYRLIFSQEEETVREGVKRIVKTVKNE